MHMCGTWIEKEVEICATNITNTTKGWAPMQWNGEKIVKTVVSTTSTICRVSPKTQ
jgi:hypothetical protein